jgi:aminomethyltransferase
MDVHIEDISESVSALALQGPTSGRLLKTLVEDADIANLKYFRVTKGSIAGVPVEISRTGYTGDLGYEIWIASGKAIRVWDALMEAGRAFDIHPAGMLALDVARVEAGLLLIEVDFNSSKKALIEEHKRGHGREIVGLEIDWPQVESIYEEVGLPPAVSPMASRVAVPVYKEGIQVGKATTTTWSPTLKRMIALATVARGYTRVGTRLQFEITVEAVRHQVRATVVKTPFFNPKRKTASPVL